MNFRAFAPLRHRDFRLLMCGQLASNLGDAFYAVALPWYVLSVHGGVLRLGELLAAYGIARTVALAVGGHVSARLKPWTAMMGADLVRAVALTALTVVTATGPANLVVMAPRAIIIGAGEGISLPGSFAIVPALLPDRDLQAGNALTSGGTQLATLIGPALGGAAVALAGPAPAFAVDALSFVMSALTLLTIRASARSRSKAIVVEPRKDSAASLNLRRIMRASRSCCSSLPSTSPPISVLGA